MAVFQAPPSYAEVVIVPGTENLPPSQRPRFNPIWLKWFLDLAAFVSSSGGTGGGVVHNDTTLKQGGGGTEFFHLTNAEHTAAQAITTNGTAAVGQLPGTTTNDNAAAGKVGEYMSASLALGSAASLTTATGLNVITLALTAGDWDVEGVVGFSAGGATTIQSQACGVTSSTGALPAVDSGAMSQSAESLTGGVDTVLRTPSVRFSLATGTTIYLVAKATFAISTMSAYGLIRARRIR